MKISKLQYITQGTSEAEILVEVNEAIEAGVDWVQLRIKDESLDFLSIAKKVKVICGNKAVFLINDKVEIAMQIDADGVHLGIEDMPIFEAREKLGVTKIIGGTANTIEDCLDHLKKGANYIGLGPYRMTTTKKKLSPILGIEGYKNCVTDQIEIPVVAIGGIELADIDLLRKETNVHGIAVSGLIACAMDKNKLVGEIQDKLGFASSKK